MARGLTKLPHRRRKENRTDYKNRLKLLKSKKTRLVVRRSSKSIYCQLINYETEGDVTLLSISSSKLRNFGWNTNTGNIPSAYLTGLLTGVKAKEKGVKEAVLDMGLYTSVKGSRIYATLKGFTDAGIQIPHSEDAIPDDKRISGAHITNYAASLKKEKPTQYKKLFSGYSKNNQKPEDVQDQFLKVKDKILGGKSTSKKPPEKVSSKKETGKEEKAE